MSKSIFVIKHKDGYIEETYRDSFKVSGSIYDAKEYKRLGNALRAMKSVDGIEVVEVAEDNRREWRGSYRPNEEAASA